MVVTLSDEYKVKKPVPRNGNKIKPQIKASIPFY